MDIQKAITDGNTLLGIELGSTRIKAVLIDEHYNPIASGAHDWESQFENGVWTYSLDAVWSGLQDSFRKLSQEVQQTYGVPLTTVGAFGISAMMHGYLVFDKNDTQLVPFRTWRNTMTEQSAALLTEKLNFNIPQRWSIAHLYQAVLQQEEHVKDIAFLTTLAGYVHWQLTGQKVLGVGDASGMFPIDSVTGNYNAQMIEQFNSLVDFKLQTILPTVLGAGANAGTLTAEGAKRLDPTGTLRAGVPMCPPEGDAGTGMVATNSVAERTGNVSAGTSIFAMLVLEKALSKLHTEIDMVTTPSGKPVAMVHCNSCTSDLDAWVKLFGETLALMGHKVSKAELYDKLYVAALDGDPNCGGVLSYNYYAGEPITGLENGCPLFVRTPDSRFTLANFMRAQLFATMATLKIGMDILTEQEQVSLTKLLGHGGLFKTKGVGQRLMAAALNVPIAVMASAAEGGAWGIALLAAYMTQKDATITLENFLSTRVFSKNECVSVSPDEQDVEGFNAYMERYKTGLAIERAAVDSFR